MRALTKTEIATIYFKIAPYLIGEGFILGGLGMLVFAFSDIEALLGLLFFGAGCVFAQRKITIVKIALRVFPMGVKTISQVIEIQNTNAEHNQKTVREYTFQYKVNDEIFKHQFRSAYHRNLEIGQSFQIYYLPEDPKIGFIPKLYSLDI